MYASGLAVECLLRAFRLLDDPTFDERHDLWKLWQKTALADIQRESTHEKIYALLSVVNLHWRNSLRSASSKEVSAFLKNSNLHRGIKGDFLKHNSKLVFESAKELIQLGGRQWKKLSKN